MQLQHEHKKFMWKTMPIPTSWDKMYDCLRTVSRFRVPNAMENYDTGSNEDEYESSEDCDVNIFEKPLDL